MYSGRLTLLRTAPDPRLPSGDYQLGWGGLAAGGVEVHEIAGDHLRITDEPNVQVLAEKLRGCLGRVEQPALPLAEAPAAKEPTGHNIAGPKEPRGAERPILESCA